MHRARPALSVSEERPENGWHVVDSLESNALVLYEFTPLSGESRPHRSLFPLLYSIMDFHPAASVAGVNTIMERRMGSQADRACWTIGVVCIGK
jgi:hypothetical protein